MTQLSDIRIPYGAYWSTPFSRWQMSLSALNSLKLAANTAKAALKARNIEIGAIDHGVLGVTVPQEKSFWGVPWVTAMMGSTAITGPTVSQACATSARCLATSAGEILTGNATASLTIACDRTSNSPVLLYPNPHGASGSPVIENWVLDNFREDPNAHVAMVETAENCARQWQISKSEQDDVALMRYQQYEQALADDKAFHKRFMMTPFDVPDPQFRKTKSTIAGDEGIHPTTADGLAKLKPVMPDGTVTFGGQTHPADGNAGMLLVQADKVANFTSSPNIDIRILGFGNYREKPAFMPAAPVTAARRALENAGLKISDIDAIKSHNPFVVNDIVFSRETGVDVAKMNNYGCSLIFGHPQGPTGLRLIIELIEELVMRGGGKGLFHGCAAGDTSMALVLSVTDRAAKSS